MPLPEVTSTVGTVVPAGARLPEED